MGKTVAYCVRGRKEWLRLSLKCRHVGLDVLWCLRALAAV